MRSFTVVVALSAVLAAVSAASVRHATAYDKYGDYKEYNKRPDTKMYEKCAGAAGYPYVHYAPCAKGYHCAKKDKYGHGEWGMYCMPIPKDYSPKCYVDKARCAGADHKPYVKYYPCCSKSSVCMEVPEYGWGKFCVAKKGDYKTPDTYKYEEEYKDDYKVDTKKYADYGYGKCHMTGAKCSGSKGYPYVDYADGCCSGYDVCVEGKKYGSWGGYCVKKSTYDDDYKKDHYDHKHYKKDHYTHEKYDDKKDSYDDKYYGDKDYKSYGYGYGYGYGKGKGKGKMTTAPPTTTAAGGPGQPTGVVTSTDDSGAPGQPTSVTTTTDDAGAPAQPTFPPAVSPSN